LNHLFIDEKWLQIFFLTFFADLLATKLQVFKVLQNMLLMLDSFKLSPNEKEVVEARVNKLLELIESEPKS